MNPDLSAALDEVARQVARAIERKELLVETYWARPLHVMGRDPGLVLVSVHRGAKALFPYPSPAATARPKARDRQVAI